MHEKTFRFNCFSCDGYFDLAASKRGTKPLTSTEVRIALTSTLASWVYSIIHGIKINDRVQIDRQCKDGNSHFASRGFIYDPESPEGLRIEEDRQNVREIEAKIKLFSKSPQAYILTPWKHPEAKWN